MAINVKAGSASGSPTTSLKAFLGMLTIKEEE